MQLYISHSHSSLFATGSFRNSSSLPAWWVGKTALNATWLLLQGIQIGKVRKLLWHHHVLLNRLCNSCSTRKGSSCTILVNKSTVIPRRPRVTLGSSESQAAMSFQTQCSRTMKRWMRTEVISCNSAIRSFQRSVQNRTETACGQLCVTMGERWLIWRLHAALRCGDLTGSGVLRLLKCPKLGEFCGHAENPVWFFFSTFKKGVIVKKTLSR